LLVAVLLLAVRGVDSAAQSRAVDVIAPVRETAVTPAVRVHRFYRWYLAELRDGHDPLTERHQTLARFVTSQRLGALQTELEHGSLDADYFLGAQDWLLSWPDAVHVTTYRWTKTRADVRVMLGTGAESAIRLVRLHPQRGEWRIDRIQSVEDRAGVLPMVRMLHLPSGMPAR